MERDREREKRLAVAVGAKVVRLAEAKGWDQSTLAERADVSRSNVHRCWNAERAPRLIDAMKLARALGVPLDYLADESMANPPAGLTAEQEWVLDVVATLGFRRAKGRLIGVPDQDAEREPLPGSGFEIRAGAPAADAVAERKGVQRKNG